MTKSRMIPMLTHPAMKIHRLALLASLLFTAALPASADPLLQPNDKLAFCGDSMTGGLYTNYIERYLIACQPALPLDMKQFGWSAETPDAFLGRLDKDLTPWKPTVVTLLYNFGDDGQPLNQAAIDARGKAETAVIDALKKAGVRAIVLGSAPCADSTLYHHDPAKAAAYNTKLAAVAAADKAVAAQEGIAYADVFGASSAMMANAKTKLGADYNFAGDDIRQQPDGLSIAIAYAFIKALNLNGDIGTFTVHFNPDHLIEKVETSGDPGRTNTTPRSPATPSASPATRIPMSSCPACRFTRTSAPSSSSSPACPGRRPASSGTKTPPGTTSTPPISRKAPSSPATCSGPTAERSR
jgi:hypothetical protein